MEHRLDEGGRDTVRLMIVGGGGGQLHAIRKAQSLGIEVIVSDRDPTAPGMQIADYPAAADTFDADATAKAARLHGAEGITTLGTDQPVLTVTRAAGRLGLPRALTPEQALAATNKRWMKPALERCGVPHSPYLVVDRGFRAEDLRGLPGPYVLKPVDSQGQRGVVRLETAEEVSRYLPETLQYSRDGYALVEEFYPGGEITFSGWVRDGEVYPLAITDRRTMPFYPHIGVCIAHTYPSRFSSEWEAEILDISRRIVGGIGIRRGPLYFQMLIGPEGVRVNEIACRIGGAYEDEFIPLLTGVDVDALQFFEALGEKSVPVLREGFERDCFGLGSYRYPSRDCMAVLLFFTRPMQVAGTAPVEDVLAVPGVHRAAYLLPPGRAVGPMRNSTGRAGYIIIKGSTKESVNRAIREAYSRLGIFDQSGRNGVIDYSAESMLE